MSRTVSLFGATGTIGDNTLDLLARHSDRFSLFGATANQNIEKLIAIAERHKPQVLVVGDEQGRADLLARIPHYAGDVLVGESGLLQLAAQKVDVAVMGIVGFAGLAPSLACAKNGNRLALANKEALVAAGALLMQTAATAGTEILPVDSEHNAIFQLLQGQGDISEVEKIVLTASGGPFRNKSLEEMAQVTPEQAVAHPNWDMGAKISVDSATLMNKGLELIEAHYLFDLEADRLDALVHPQSIVHGLVHFTDGSVLAQKGSPDMRGPLAYCLAYPHRMETGVAPLDLTALGRLDFEAADRVRFPCLALAEAAMAAEGAAPNRLNAANETAVSAFLDGRIGFLQIAEVVAETMAQPSCQNSKSLEGIIACDAETRAQAKAIISKV